jgi:valyl-tRNA synthetase
MSERREQADLEKGYEPAQVEPHWARWWEERGFFRSQDESDKPAFSIVLPPPNVTGSLHLGHALTATMQDVLIRYKRMSGFNACWLPGIDHAGIATQMVVERELGKKEKKSRHDLGREEFLKRVWAWKEESGNRIALQHRALGASLDWDRERFTMDERSSRAVREAFVRLHEEGLLYRAERLINWCVKDGTALSDLEVDHEEGTKAELYKFAYPLANGSGEIVVATTRVETMLGDTAVAVHPDDERYKAMIGKNVRHPITGREFPIIADAELVDPKFGTGAVKVTPAHSFEDFESGKRHNLPLLNILNLDGTLNEVAGPFAGQDRIKVRPALKERLKELGLERGTEAHVLALGKCQRCQSVVEPLLSKQWFVKTKPLAQAVIEHVDDMRFVPDNWRAEFLRWMTNIHDWCVSRQLWWGHQIPAWYCAHGHENVAREKPSKCSQCDMTELVQDPDVLDTWFSSGLWPFSTFGWPEETKALETFYPNSVMETGFDILFFWVARMAMFGLHFLGEVPFEVVFLHAMVRDEKGQKMSKTKGNVIDPLDITAKYGADALRFTLASMAGQGRDIKLSTDRIAGYRAFANKIWNAARFVLMNAEGFTPGAAPSSLYDRWILSRYQRCADETRIALDEFRLSDAANGIYKFIWNELCDWAIELSKPALYGHNSAAERASAQGALLTALEGALRLLHPFMPFVTEEIWQRLPNRSAAAGESGSAETIMLAAFPAANDDLKDEQAEREMDILARAIDGARSVRGEVNLPPNQRVPLWLFAKDEMLFRRHERAFQHLANASEVTLRGMDGERPRGAAVHVEPEVEVHLPLQGLIDFAAEKTRVEKELQRIATELEGIDKRLGNEGFVARAPKEVVEKDRARAEELGAKREKLARHLARVTSVEAGMEEKNPQQPQADSAGPSEQPNRSLGQMGTHGGPAQGSPAQGEEPEESEATAAASRGGAAGSEGPEGDDDDEAGEKQTAAPGKDTGKDDESEDEEDDDDSDDDEESAAQARNEGDEELESPQAKAASAGAKEGKVPRTIARVKSIARGLMQKKPQTKKAGPRSQEAVNAERAQAAKASQKKAAPKAKPAKKPVALGKSVRGGKNKADKAGKVGKTLHAGRVAAAKGAKKGTRGAGGKLKKQAKAAPGSQSRQNLRGRFASSAQGKGRTGAGSGRGGGRGSQRGARGQSGKKQRPSPRKGTK